MRSIKHFIDNVMWYFNGFYTGIGLTVLLIYVLVNENEKRKHKKIKEE